mmetsp:Transcript_139066/g.387921  ORF Transcript_139066/g.387921 Transcript_139066/m.387921 type:complete len:247 (-) Transcript_139066:114-854(-)
MSCCDSASTSSERCIWPKGARSRCASACSSDPSASPNSLASRSLRRCRSRGSSGADRGVTGVGAGRWAACMGREEMAAAGRPFRLVLAARAMVLRPRSTSSRPLLRVLLLRGRPATAVGGRPAGRELLLRVPPQPPWASSSALRSSSSCRSLSASFRACSVSILLSRSSGISSCSPLALFRGAGAAAAATVLERPAAVAAEAGAGSGSSASFSVDTCSEARRGAGGCADAGDADAGIDGLAKEPRE